MGWEIRYFKCLQQKYTKVKCKLCKYKLVYHDDRTVKFNYFNLLLILISNAIWVIWRRKYTPRVKLLILKHNINPIHQITNCKNCKSQETQHQTLELLRGVGGYCTCRKSNSQLGERSTSNFVKFNCRTFVVLVIMSHAQFTLWPYSMLPECGYWSVPDKPARTPPQPAETK